MINKSELQSIISKYYLGGLIESVRWVTNDKHLNISFDSPNREMKGTITHKDFPLDDSEIGITDTNKLTKLLAITSGLIQIRLESTHKVYTKLTFEDANYTLEYPLGDIQHNIFKKPIGVEDNFSFEINCELTNEILDNIIKAKSALDSSNVVFNVGKNFDGDSVVELIFGETSSHSNKITYIIPDVILPENTPTFSIPFNSDLLKIVLGANKGFTNASLSLNTQGLLKLYFESDNIESLYYIVRKAIQ